jgi:hypothetical protein
MLPLVVALTLSLASPPGLPALPDLPRVAPPRTPRCPDPDPRFVRHVAPPEGAGPLWAISDTVAGPEFVPRQLDVGQSALARWRPTLPAAGCGPIPVTR